MTQRYDRSYTCDEARLGLQEAWSRDGEFAASLSSTVTRPAPAAAIHAAESSTPSRPSALLRHIEECIACRGEAMALAQMDRWLRQGFQALEQRTELPGEETISTMLRRLEPESVSQRRLRRAARTALWLGVLGFLLIAACALLALAYRVLNGS